MYEPGFEISYHRWIEPRYPMITQRALDPIDGEAHLFWVAVHQAPTYVSRNLQCAECLRRRKTQCAGFCVQLHLNRIHSERADPGLHRQAKDVIEKTTQDHMDNGDRRYLGLLRRFRDRYQIISLAIQLDRPRVQLANQHGNLLAIHSFLSPPFRARPPIIDGCKQAVSKKLIDERPCAIQLLPK